jgi:DNA-binding NtrC family response regulator
MKIIANYSGDRDQLASALGISKRTLFRKLQSLKE